MSIGFSVFALTSSSEKRAHALLMLPLYLQPGAPRSGEGNLFLGLMGLALFGFYGALVALFVIGPWLLAIVGGIALLSGKVGFQGWWIRHSNCRPMKPFILWSAVLLLLYVAAISDALL